MKKLLIILILLPAFLKAQTVISPTTTVAQLANLGMGNFTFTIKTAGKQDTVVSFSKDTSLIIRIFIHDTIPRVCAVCPPPVVCPICPAPVKQRTVTGITLDLITNKKTITYDDGSKTVL